MLKDKRNYFIAILFVIFAIAVYFALFAGNQDWGLHFVKKLFALNGDTDSVIIESLRLPRVLRAIIAGSALATAGLFLQSVSKNPLAEPYITGISSGAGLAIVASVLFFGGANYTVFGFFGALTASLLVITFCGFGKFSVSKLILVGMSVNMFASSIISFSILLNSDKTYALIYILSGGVSEGIEISLKMLAVLAFTGFLMSVIFIPKLNFFRLDSALMPQYKKQRELNTFLIIAVSAFLSALSVLAAGILGFVGIIAPLISKILVGNDYRWLYFTNILIGSILILMSDFISRCAIYPLQIPLGLVIAFIGAPIFVYFLMKKRGIFHD